MRSLRFNIANLLGVILFLGVGFAALRESDDLRESAILNLTFGVLLVSILVAVRRTEAKPAFWIGFALFGWGYVALSSIPSIDSRLLTTKELTYLDSKVPGRPAYPAKLMLWTNHSAGSGNQNHYVAFAVDGLKVGTTSDRVVRVWDVATGKLLTGWSGTTENFIRIGNSLIALLAAWIDGQLSRRLSRGSRSQEEIAVSDAEA
jgi:hypothetical protein